MNLGATLLPASKILSGYSHLNLMCETLTGDLFPFIAPRGGGVSEAVD